MIFETERYTNLTWREALFIVPSFFKELYHSFEAGITVDNLIGSSIVLVPIIGGLLAGIRDEGYFRIFCSSIKSFVGLLIIYLNISALWDIANGLLNDSFAQGIASIILIIALFTTAEARIIIVLLE